MSSDRRCLTCDHFRPAGLWSALDPLLDSSKMFVLAGGCALPRNIRKRGDVELWRCVREDSFCSDHAVAEFNDPFFDSDDYPPNREEDDADAEAQEAAGQLGLFVRENTHASSK